VQYLAATLEEARLKDKIMPELKESVMNCEATIKNEQDFVTLDDFVS
jgi:hypothetical protein